MWNETVRVNVRSPTFPAEHLCCDDRCHLLLSLIGIAHLVIISPFCIVTAVYTRVCLLCRSAVVKPLPNGSRCAFEVNLSFSMDYFSIVFAMVSSVLRSHDPGVFWRLNPQEMVTGGLTGVTTQITALRGSLCEAAPPMSSLVHFCPLWPLSRCFGLSGQGD